MRKLTQEEEEVANYFRSFTPCKRGKLSYMAKSDMEKINGLLRKFITEPNIRNSPSRWNGVISVIEYLGYFGLAFTDMVENPFCDDTVVTTGRYYMNQFSNMNWAIWLHIATARSVMDCPFAGPITAYISDVPIAKEVVLLHNNSYPGCPKIRIEEKE